MDDVSRMRYITHKTLKITHYINNLQSCNLLIVNQNQDLPGECAAPRPPAGLLFLVQHAFLFQFVDQQRGVFFAQRGQVGRIISLRLYRPHDIAC